MQGGWGGGAPDLPKPTVSTLEDPPRVVVDPPDPLQEDQPPDPLQEDQLDPPNSDLEDSQDLGGAD